VEAWSQDEERLLERIHSEARALHLARSLALVGFMGAGKTSLGRLVAEGLGRPFVDTDEEVERRGGRPIPAWFAAGDEAGFRELEARVARDLVEGPPVVLSLGGGALGRTDTRDLLLERCFVVHLHVPWPDVRAALPELRTTRPLLQGRSETEIHDLWLRRQATYRSAHLRIDAPRTSVAEAAERVLTLLRCGEPAAARA
jgi:shikimate kinase